MGRMLDALRRIEAEKATTGRGRAGHDGAPASTPAGTPSEELADSPGNVPRPAAIPVAPDRFGLFQPSVPRERRAPSALAAATPCSPDGQQVPPSQAPPPFPPASRWWKTPPRAQPAPARDLPPTDEDRAVPRPEASRSEATADREPEATGNDGVGNDAVSSTDVPRASADLISRLLEEFPPGRNAVILLCDPESGDVTFAVASLAVALAGQVADAVLAIDATSRGAGLERLAAREPHADRNPGPGLLDVLDGRAGWEQAARATNLSNLAVLPGAAPPPTAQVTSPLHPNGHWTAAIRQLRGRYRFVLIGVAPGEDAATAALARQADAIYLVICPGRTGRRAASRVARSFRGQGGRVAGCIVLAPTR